MKKIKTILLFLFFIGINFNVQAQLSGSKTIPGSYPTIAAAITDLDSQGVGGGGVTFNVAAGHTETASNLVIAILTNQPTAANPVVFQSPGVGANPLVTASPGVDSLYDGIIKLSGADYITFDGIDLLDPVSNTGNARMDWGYSLNRASPTDGSQNNVIKNCNITLQKANIFSVGISVINRDTAGVIIAATDPAGQNSFNRFYGNTISNVYDGIGVISVSTTRDLNNEIGVNGLAPNNISNWGGSTVTAHGIQCEGQINVKINNNIINGGAGTSGSGTAYGILATLFGVTALAPNYEISYNHVTVTAGPSSQVIWGIRALATGDTVSLHHNIVENCNAAQTTNGFTALTHDPTGTTNAAYIYQNIVRNNTHSGTGASSLIVGGSASSGPITYLSIHANKVYGNQKTGASGTINCILDNDGSAEVDSNVVYDNSIPNSSGTSSSIMYGYINSGDPVSEKVYNNSFYNLTVGGSNTSASSLVVGIRSNAAATTAKELYGNKIYNLSGVSGTSTTGGVYGIFSTLSLSALIHTNKIYNLTNSGLTGTTAGCWVSSGSGIQIYNNTINNLKAPNSSNANAVIGINSTSTTALSTIGMYSNSIYLSAAGASTFGSSGVSVSGSTTATTAALDMRYNNIINLSIPGSTSGLTVAYRRSNVNLQNYALTSDSNNLYAGPQAVNRLIFYDGTNSDQTLALYKARVAPRDANSTTTGLQILNLIINHEAFSATDTIIVEIRSSVSPYNLVESVTTTGGAAKKSSIQLANVVDGVNYYIVVRHRNSIETWSKSGGEVFTAGVLNYDFTSADTQAYGDNQVLVGSEYSLYTGDVNQDDVVSLLDIIAIHTDVTNFVSGPYVVTDLNYNGAVNLTDLIFAYNNRTMFIVTERPF